MIPVFREWDLLPSFLEEVSRYSIDIAIVNDGNGPEFTETFTELGYAVIEHESNVGVGTAITSALRLAASAGYTGVITADGDGAHPTSEVMRVLVRARLDPTRSVFTSRFGHIGERYIPGSKIAANRFAAELFSRVTGHQIVDAACGLRYLPIWAANEIWSEQGFGFIYESLARLMDLNKVGYVLPVFVSYPRETPLVTKLKEISEFVSFCSGCKGWDESLDAMVGPLRQLNSGKGPDRLSVTLAGLQFNLDWVPARKGYIVHESSLRPRIDPPSAPLGDVGAVGMIPDGGRRWAQIQGISIRSSYSQSALRIATFVDEHRSQIHTLAVYWLSQYNLKRPDEQLADVYSAVFEMLDLLKCHSISCIFVGALNQLPTTVFDRLRRANMEAQMGTDHPLVIVCMAYSADWETAFIQGGVRPWELGLGSEFAERFEALRLGLVLRSGGAKTLSEFLPRASSYASLHFDDLLFNEVDLGGWYNGAAASLAEAKFGP